MNTEESDVKHLNLINVSLKFLDIDSYLDKNFLTISSLKYRRPPKLILKAKKWDLNGDIWAIGCYLFVLFTCEVIFTVESDEEHLYLISKFSRHFPKQLIDKCTIPYLKKLFIKYGKNHNDYKFDVTKSKNSDIIKNIFIYKCSFYEKFYENDLILADFIKSLLRINRTYRPNLVKIFNHGFFRYNYE